MRTKSDWLKNAAAQGARLWQNGEFNGKGSNSSPQRIAASTRVLVVLAVLVAMACVSALATRHTAHASGSMLGLPQLSATRAYQYLATAVGLPVTTPKAAMVTPTAVVLANYGFSGGSLAPTSQNASVTASNINFTGSAASPYPAPGFPYLFLTVPAGATNATTAVSSNSYFQLTLTPNGAINLTNLTFGVGGNNAPSGGVQKEGYVVRSSADNYGSNLASGIAPVQFSSLSTITVDLSAAAFQNLSSAVTFRIYGFINTSTSAERDPAIVFNNITFNGTVAAPPVPEINLIGNGNPIANFSFSPSTTNDTDFGSTVFGSGAVEKTFTIENLGGGPLNLTGPQQNPVKPLVELTGSDAAAFSVTAQPSTPIAGGSSTTFKISFNPSMAGTKNASVTITNDDADESSYLFLIRAATCISNPVVTTTADSGAGSLRDAIANACAGSTITFDPSVFGSAQTITLSTGRLDIPRNLTITGPGADKLTVNQTASFTEVFSIQSGNTVNISGLKITGGGSGGVYNFGGTVTLTNCELSGNTNNAAVTNSSPGVMTLTGCVIKNNPGGGFANFSTSITVTNCDLSDNGGFNAAAYNSTGALTLTDTTIKNNTGGGINHFGTTANITNCEISGNSGFNQAVYNSSGNMTLTDCNIHDNPKGGVVNFGPQITITNCQIVNNTSTNLGGGIYHSSGTLTLSDSTISGNTGSGGGGIVTFGTSANITNTKILNNTASNNNNGGGIMAFTNTTLTDCTITGNTATDLGGGIYAAASTTVIRSTIANNTAEGGDGGGGIYGSSGTVTLTNSTISGNHATSTSSGSRGGGLRLSTTTEITSCTITENDVNGTGADNSVGGILNSSGSVTIKNTIVAGNSGTNGANKDVKELSAFTSGGYNLIGDGTGATGFTGTADQVGTSGSPIPALLGPLADNGGRTSTHALQSGSPAIDKGSAFSLTTDQRGTVRTYDALGVTNAGDGTDIGAYEASPQEINVKGNTITIASGATNPQASDNTFFGFAAVVGGTTTRTFVIENLGGSPLNLTGTPKVALGGTNAADFAVTTLPTSPILPGNSVSFVITFDPSAADSRDAIVSIANDDADETPYTFAILGIGQAPDINLKGNNTTIASGSTTPNLNNHTDFGTANVASGTLTRTFTIENLGEIDLNLTGTPKVQLSGANAADFSVTTQPTSPVPSGTPDVPPPMDLQRALAPAAKAAPAGTNFVVAFDPSVPGLRTATVSIANDDPDENPYTFTIQGGGCASSLTVTTTADSGAGSLREAIANACPGATITFASPLFDAAQTITLTSGVLAIDKNLTINGPGAKLLTVSGNNADRVFVINANVIATINDVTVTGGLGTPIPTAFNTRNGGAIFIHGSGQLTLNNCTISNSEATGAGNGGGICNNGTLTVNNSTISGNTTAGDGGGILNNGPNAMLTVANSTISGNTATANGGGINNTGTMTVGNSTITNNSASAGGGLINFTSMSLKSTVVVGNTAGNRPDLFSNSGTSQGYNLFGSGTLSPGFTTVATDILTSSPGLGPLTDNGGPTLTHALRAGSPALDKGISNGVTTDQRGLPRPYDLMNIAAASGGDGSDMGAYELQCTPITLTPASLPSGYVGLPYANPLSATGSTAPYSFSVTGGSLPVGLTLNSNGSWSGVAAASGTYNFTVTVTDAIGCTGSQSYALTFVCPPVTFTPLTLAGGTVGAAYSQGLAVSNAFGNAAAFTLLNGALPPGVSLTSAGLLAGTPTQPGPYSFTVKATDTLGCSGTQSYSLTIACNTLVLGTTSLSPATKGVAYSQTLAVTNGRGAVSYALANGSALPQGLTLAANGVISGTPTAAAATGTFTVLVTDANGCTGSGTLTLNVTCPLVTLAALPSATAGSNYSAQLQASPAGGSYAYSSANVPSGLTLAADGTLSGTLATAGSFSFNVTVTGWGNCTATVAVTLTGICPAVTVPGTLAGGVQGQAYNQSVAASPAGGNYTYAVTTNTLPPGLTLGSTTGAITGTPTAAGNYAFSVTATGWGGCSKVQAYNLTITNTCNLLTLTPTSLPGVTVGMAYNQTLSAAGGVAPYSFAVTAGTLPTGVTLSSAGVLGGTPSVTGSFNFTVTATSSAGCTGTQSYTLVVACPTITFTPNTLPNATAGVAYNQTVTASPAGSYTYSLATGNLPPGLSLNATSGAITGTATALGTYTFSLKADRGASCNATKSYTVVVSCPTLVLSPETLPGGTVGTAYSQSFSATPATGSYTYARLSGNLPTGLTLSSAGVLSGTPTTVGSFTFVVRVTGFSSTSCNTTRSYTVVIGASCAAITLPSLPGTGAQGATYYGDLSATTPSGAYTFSLDSGTLPPGLVLDNLFGALLGSATQAGSYSFTVKARSATGCTGTRAYTVVINGGAALALFADYDGDRQADPVLWRAASGAWDILLSQQTQGTSTRWGAAGDVTLLGDYDGDGKTDLAVFRPSNGTWYIQRSSDGSYLVQAWGLGTDVPTPGDYDGDGKTDLAVWRGTTGTWYILRSTDDQVEVQLWGSSSAPYYDVPVTGDYDGDGKTDLGVFRRGTGTWLLKRSSDAQARLKQWGVGSDVPVVGDYDGDGQTDLAVWRGATGQWFVLQSSDQSYRVTEWGAASMQEQPVAGDYDGDGRADYMVWRSTSAEWRVRLSGGAAPRTQAQGQRGDQPVTARQP